MPDSTYTGTSVARAASSGAPHEESATIPLDGVHMLTLSV
jgi:hypothetical protein